MTYRILILPVILLSAASSSRLDADAVSTNAPVATTPSAPLEPAPPSAPTAIAPGSTAPEATAMSAERPSTYKVVTGDTLWDISHKFNCSIRSLKKLNKLKKDHLKPGQVLKIPPAHASTAKPTASAEAVPSEQEAGQDQAPSTAKPTARKTARAKSGKSAHSDAELATLGKTKTHHHAAALVAQPVQDFDIPASTFASCPTPPSNGADEIIPPPQETATTPPGPAASPHVFLTPPVSSGTTFSFPGKTAFPAQVPQTSAPSQNLAHNGAAAVPVPPAPAKKSFASALADFFGGSGSDASESGEWGNRFLTETRNLASRGIGYDQSWRPEGESHSWAMDCSNTTRYLYQVTAGIQLPRTASDQYYYLHLQNKAWDVPTVSSGFADCNFLRSNLKPGDLLFWENTYRPDRQPPITHVMIFLGTNAKGQWIMAGSQSSHGGEFNPHRSGPDVYVFDPTRPTGGYTTWLGLVHHQGRFCAYGRPLEADVKKLSVAAND